MNSHNNRKQSKRITLRKLLHIWHGKDRTTRFYSEDIEANRGYAIAASFGLLFFVPLTASPDSKFGRYWANQGVIMLVVTLGSALATLVAGGILSLLGAIPYIGIVFRIIKIVLIILVALANAALMARGCYFASKGFARDFPLIGYIRVINFK